MADIFSFEKRREIMRRVKNRNTDIEIIIRKELHKRGYKYRVKNILPGRPDVIFPKDKLAVFCDGDFWHGKNFKKEKSGYKPFWVEKITTNIKRDRKVNKELTSRGWKVLRFWKTDILKNPSKCVNKIEKYLNSILKTGY